MIAAISEPTTSGDAGSVLWKTEKPEVSMNSAHAISATVPPPTPLNSATSCGMAVILVFNAGGIPSATPSARPMAIRIQLMVGTPTVEWPSSPTAPSL